MVERADSDERGRREISILDGRAYRSIAIAAASTTRVGHNLGHAPRGFIITNSTTPGPGTIYLSAWDSGSVTLGNSHATVAVTVDIWLY